MPKCASLKTGVNIILSEFKKEVMQTEPEGKVIAHYLEKYTESVLRYISARYDFKDKEAEE